MPGTCPPPATTDSPSPAPAKPNTSRAPGSSTPVTSRPLGSVAPADSSTSASPATGAALARLVTRGAAPAAALFPCDGTGSRPTSASREIARADHFRAGSVTATFTATVVLQLAAGHGLSPSDSMDAPLPGPVRGATDAPVVVMSSPSG
ncbi:hypothetical protein [Streptomyces fagopyri]|uniref:hypothetical protein n=1 Tax=Streptomyces fagopyri TaxID=2662397 RepID=UPI0033E82C56